MSRGTGRRALVATAIIGFVVGIAVSVRYDLVSRSDALNLFGGGDQQQSGNQPPPVVLPDFADLSEHMSPSVVNISSTQEVKSGSTTGGGWLPDCC